MGSDPAPWATEAPAVRALAPWSPGDTLEDYKAPTASSFTTRTAQCQNSVAAVEEVSGSAARAGREA